MLQREFTQCGGPQLVANDVFVAVRPGFSMPGWRGAYVLSPHSSLTPTTQLLSGRRAYRPCASRAYPIGPMTPRISTTSFPVLANSPFPLPLLPPQTEGFTHIILPAEIPDGARDNDDVHEREPGGPLRPAEVLVPVLDHDCRPRGSGQPRRPSSPAAPSHTTPPPSGRRRGLGFEGRGRRKEVFDVPPSLASAGSFAIPVLRGKWLASGCVVGRIGGGAGVRTVVFEACHLD